MPDDEPTMFDPDAYSDLTRLHRRAKRRQPPAPEVEPVVVTEPGWIVLAFLKRRPSPMAHRVALDMQYGSSRSLCGVVGRRLVEVEVGREARLCSKCAEAESKRRAAP